MNQSSTSKLNCFAQVVYARKGASAAAAAQAGSMLAAPGMSSLPEDTPAPAESSSLGTGPLFRAASAPVAPVDPAALKRNAPFSVPQMLRQVSRVASVGSEPEESAEVAEAEEEDGEEEEEEEEEASFSGIAHNLEMPNWWMLVDTWVSTVQSTIRT